MVLANLDALKSRGKRWLVRTAATALLVALLVVSMAGSPLLPWQNRSSTIRLDIAQLVRSSFQSAGQASDRKQTFKTKSPASAPHCPKCAPSHLMTV
jgi:hypothetical protein